MYDKLLNKYEDQVTIKEEKMPPGLPGLFINSTIYIDKRMPSTKKTCILIEEIMHWKYTEGNIFNQKKIPNVKQEVFARRRGYEMLVPLQDLIDCFYSDMNEYFEIAEHLGVTEDFLRHTIAYYREKYGLMHQYGRYLVSFGNTIEVYQM